MPEVIERAHYEAFKAADGVSEEQAAAAAASTGAMVVELRVMKWMMGFMIALQVGTIGMMFQIVIRLP